MQVGDLVQQSLTEQIGVIVSESRKVYNAGYYEGPEVHSFEVLWLTQGLSLFGIGAKEWVKKGTVEVIGASRQLS